MANNIKLTGTTIIDTQKIFKSKKDGLPIMPWRLLHDGYEVTQQETVVSVDPDSGVPITHSKFSVGGRIISAKIFVDTEIEFWIWWKNAIQNRALPFWVYDVNVNGFMRCYATEQAKLSPAGTSVNGRYVQLKLYTRSSTISLTSFITENMPENYVLEGADNYLIDNDEVLY